MCLRVGVLSTGVLSAGVSQNGCFEYWWACSGGVPQ